MVFVLNDFFICFRAFSLYVRGCVCARASEWSDRRICHFSNWVRITFVLSLNVLRLCAMHCRQRRASSWMCEHFAALKFLVGTFLARATIQFQKNKNILHQPEWNGNPTAVRISKRRQQWHNESRRENKIIIRKVSVGCEVWTTES